MYAQISSIKFAFTCHDKYALDIMQTRRQNDLIVIFNTCANDMFIPGGISNSQNLCI